MKKLTFNFHNIDTVTGYCHDCQEDSILVAIVSEFYRCTNCGADTKQHINGKIRYIRLTDEEKEYLRNHGET
jgi:Zn finger protein HypA/HybF involved in hydrogenase expression|tara:strand:+ start:99 stop:314 length:216 start_codon:yes stop_codon:yes gene_type:complete